MAACEAPPNEKGLDDFGASALVGAAFPKLKGPDVAAGAGSVAWDRLEAEGAAVVSAAPNAGFVTLLALKANGLGPVPAPEPEPKEKLLKGVAVEVDADT